MHSPTPSCTEEQILVLFQVVDILYFLEQSCSYITHFLRSGRSFKMALYQPFAKLLVMPARVLIGFHTLSGAYINWFIVRKRQDIILE